MVAWTDTGQRLERSGADGGHDVLEWDGEQLLAYRDPETGLQVVVAVHDTTLGPGFGGVRWRPYPSVTAAAREVQDLARAMSRKNALAGIPYGGAKAVVLAGSAQVDRGVQLAALARAVAQLGGAYVPGVDMGTSTDDLRQVRAHGVDVACADEDPSPWTALGVLAAIRAGVEACWGTTDLTERSVLVQGVGHVGEPLARHLADAGANVIVADIDSSRASALAEQVGGTAVAADSAVTAACDVFAPCSAPAVITHGNVERIRSRVVAGAANNPLADPSLADALARRGILYLPDFVTSAGGVLQVHAERAGLGEDELRASVEQIGTRCRDLIAVSARDGVTPTAAADRMARDILGR